MRGVLQKLLVFVLAMGLIVAGPACPHAQVAPCGSAASHEANAVQHYADLNVDPADEASSNEIAPAAHHHNDDLCKKCCSACVGASLLPAAPLAVATHTASQQMAQLLSASLAARSVPTEPGIPKSL